MLKLTVAASFAVGISATFIQPACAQDSLTNASKASGDSVVAVAELSEAGVKVVAGAVALPFYAVGSATENGGRVIRESSEQVWDSANGPLTISPETPTAQPAPDVPYDGDRQRPSRQDDDRRRDNN